MKDAPTIIYVADTRLPTEKAHGLALMKLAEAFAKQGAKVEVIAPRLWTRSSKDPYMYYRVEKNFTIKFVPSIDLSMLRFFKPLLYTIQIFSFSFFAMLYCMRRYRGQRVVYFSHDYIPLFFLSFLSAPFYYDIHHFPGFNFLYRRVMSRACGFAVQTKWKVEELVRRFGIEKKDIVYWPNGTDIKDFSIDEPQAEARALLGLPKKGQLVLYVGQFFAWKGVETLLRAVPHIPTDAHMVLVGGSDEDRERLLLDIPESHDARVHFVAFQRRETIPHWLRAADVLVLPNTGTQKVSRYYTSPMKLFEYMASGRPTVASRIQSIQEILTEDMAYLVEPDDSEDLGRAIAHVLKSTNEAGKRALKAREKVREFSWDARAKELMPHLAACAKAYA